MPVIEVPRPKPVPEIIDMLEEALQDARDGNLRALILVGAHDECMLTSAFHLGPGAAVLSLLGELRVVERDYMDACVDLRKKPAGADYVWT